MRSIHSATARRGRLGVALAAGTLLSAGVLPPAADAAGAVESPALPAGCSGTSPITCHYAVAPGNYDVSVTVGSGTSAGNTETWAEARRLVLPAVSTAAGTSKQYSFTVNVRQPEGQPTGQGGTGTPGLDIRFTGTAPQVSGVTVTPAGKPLVVYLAGDSTVCDQPTAPYTGWGQMLPGSVGRGAVIANYADSGESSGSFLANRALFPTMIGLVKPNDLVFIQFGHNDKTTSAATYRANLTTMITQVRGKGGVPVLVTPPVRHWFTGDRLNSTGLIVNNLGVDLPAEMRAVGVAQHVGVIDLTARSKALVEGLGPAASTQLYLRAAVNGVNDDTHFSPYGATRMAGLVEQGIRALNLSLVPYLRDGSDDGGGTNTTYVRLRNAHTSLFVDGEGRTGNGSDTGQWSGGSSTNQQWLLESDGSYVRIRNRATGLYLDGMGSTANGSVVGQWSDTNSANQQWAEVTDGSTVRFRNHATGLYLDGMGHTGNGDDLGQYSDTGSSNQEWAEIGA